MAPPTDTVVGFMPPAAAAAVASAVQPQDDSPVPTQQLEELYEGPKRTAL